MTNGSLTGDGWRTWATPTANAIDFCPSMRQSGRLVDLAAPTGRGHYCGTRTALALNRAMARQASRVIPGIGLIYLPHHLNGSQEPLHG